MIPFLVFIEVRQALVGPKAVCKGKHFRRHRRLRQGENSTRPDKCSPRRNKYYDRNFCRSDRKNCRSTCFSHRSTCMMDVGGYAGKGAPSGTPAGRMSTVFPSASFVRLCFGFCPWRGERACLAARAYAAAPVVVEVNPVFTNEGSRPYSVAVEAWHPGRLSAGRRHGVHLSADGAQPLAGKSYLCLLSARAGRRAYV